MERLTNKKEADAQRREYENRLKNGYPRNIPEERFLELAAYEDTGMTPEEALTGKELRQIHGFKNEGGHTAKGRFAPDPRKVYREFLDTWLDWLEKGSKRDKKGNPKLHRRKKGAAA